MAIFEFAKHGCLAAKKGEFDLRILDLGLHQRGFDCFKIGQVHWMAGPADAHE